jgi:hypothetical protein
MRQLDSSITHTNHTLHTVPLAPVILTAIILCLPYIPSPTISTDFRGPSHQHGDVAVGNHDDGGEETAQLIKDAVTKPMEDGALIPTKRRIGARMDADLQELSICAGRVRLVNEKDEPRSLTLLAVEFTALKPLYDFVDTGNKQITNVQDFRYDANVLREANEFVGVELG